MLDKDPITSGGKSYCHAMCCDSDTFLELCDLHPESAKVINRDAEEKNSRLI